MIRTIVGNGVPFDPANLKTFSRQMQPVGYPLGGDPWGVRIYYGYLYFGVLAQGYIGVVEGNKVRHVVEGLNKPMVFDFDEEGTLYIPEYGAHRLCVVKGGRKQLLLEGILKNPMSARFDRLHNPILYIVDTGHHRIVAYHLEDNSLEVIAGTGEPGYEDGLATEASLFFPIDLDVNSDGIMVIADGMNNRLRVVNLSSRPQTVTGIQVNPGMMTTIAGVGPSCVGARDSLSPCDIPFFGENTLATRASLNWPFAPRFDSEGRIWFIDANHNRIRLIDTQGLIHTIAGTGETSLNPTDEDDIGDGLPPLEASLYRPMDMFVEELDPHTFNIILSDTDHYRIRLISRISI